MSRNQVWAIECKKGKDIKDCVLAWGNYYTSLWSMLSPHHFYGKLIILTYTQNYKRTQNDRQYQLWSAVRNVVVITPTTG